MAGRKQGNLILELIVLLVTAAILAAVAKPMYADYATGLALSSARGDLKYLYSSMEAYYTEHRELPGDLQSAIKDWPAYSGMYKYNKVGPHRYRFVSKDKISGCYLFIDQDGTIGKQQTPN